MPRIFQDLLLPVLLLAAVAAAAIWGFVMSVVVLKVVDAVMGLRVSRSAEIEGLDLSQHGEEGYDFNT